MRLFVSLDPKEFQRLLTVAHAERRRPQDQAAVLLSKALAERPDAEQRQQDASAAREPAATQ